MALVHCLLKDPGTILGSSLSLRPSATDASGLAALGFSGLWIIIYYDRNSPNVAIKHSSRSIKELYFMSLIREEDLRDKCPSQESFGLWSDITEPHCND